MKTQDLMMTVGFVFSQDMTQVLLIRKARPDWQRGLLNGVGGKAEPGDRKPRDTMRRECREETGLDIKQEDWTFFADLLCPELKTRVCFFFARIENILDAKTMNEDEPVLRWVIDGTWDKICVPNLRWLIPLAVNWDPGVGPSRTDVVVIMEKKRDEVQTVRAPEERVETPGESGAGAVVADADGQDQAGH